MNQFDFYSTEELEHEIKRRKQFILTSPRPLDFVDWTFVVECCKQYIADLYNKNTDADSRYRIFESAITAVYGDSVWEWINKQLGYG